MKTMTFLLGLISTLSFGQSDSVVPAGTVLQIRLRTTLSSYSTKPGTTVLAEVIAPVQSGDKVILPMRTELIGYVKDARKVGLGFARETALLHLEFPRLQIPGKAEQDLAGRVTRVDDARETVDDQGRIHGIRATESFSSVLAGIAVSVSAFDPMALIFSLSSSLSIFRLPDSSIVLPAGSELKFTLTSDLPTGGPFASPYPALSLQGSDELVLQEAVRKLPFRTETQSDDTPSDLTSLLYLGSAQSIERAFAAAGWVRSDRLDGQSTYGVMRSIVENQGYRAAPMSVLTLNHKGPEYTLAKTLNTFFSIRPANPLRPLLTPWSHACAPAIWPA